VKSHIKIYKEATKKATFDPNWFCNNILRSPNDPWQSETFNAIADLDRIKAGIPTLHNHEGKTRFTICAFHGPGKTHFIAKLGHWWNFTRVGKIVCTAPKEKQLITRLWPEFGMLRNSAIDEYRSIMKVDNTSIQWGHDSEQVDKMWCMLAETASNTENLAGHHHKSLLFLVEEASGVSDRMFEVVEGALTTEGAILVLIGNPTKTEGEFYRSHTHRKTEHLYYRKKIRHDECSPKRIKPAWVKGMIEKYGESSPVVQVRVFGNFVDQGENQLLALSWVEEARRAWEPDGSNYKLRISVDVADGGIDESIITIAFIYETFTVLKKMYRYSFPAAVSPVMVAEVAMKHAVEWDYDLKRGDDIVVDSIGVGAGTAGIIIKTKLYKVIAYKGGSTQGVNTKIYRNQRARCYIGIRDDFRDGTLIIDPDFCSDGDWEEYLIQACSVQTKPGDERVEEIVSKKEVKANGGKSPDMTDSTAMVKTNQSPSLGDTQDLIIPMGKMETAHADW